MKAPAAKREVLVFLAGLVWLIVGLILIIVAIHWLTELSLGTGLDIGLGIIGGLIISRFGFAVLARQNLTRIYGQAPGKDKVCVFAFQNLRSYFIVIIMIFTGYTIRHSPIPKIYIAPIYLAIGLGLLLASLVYFRPRLPGNGRH